MQSEAAERIVDLFCGAEGIVETLGPIFVI
jgi:hypothetical protein